MTSQPNWKFLANLGDDNPVDYGGFFIFKDSTGVYEDEAVLLQSPDDDDSPEGWKVYRFIIDKLKIVDDYLVPDNYDASWPHPLPQYDEWFNKDLISVAETMGLDEDELREAFTSDNPLERAQAYLAIGYYHGFDNLDSDPLNFETRSEVTKLLKQLGVKSR